MRQGRRHLRGQGRGLPGHRNEHQAPPSGGPAIALDVFEEPPSE